MDFIMYIFINLSHYFSKLNSRSKNTSMSTTNIFHIFLCSVGCSTLTMTQIPMACKHNKLMKGATSSDVYIIWI